DEARSVLLRRRGREANWVLRLRREGAGADPVDLRALLREPQCHDRADAGDEPRGPEAGTRQGYERALIVTSSERTVLGTPLSRVTSPMRTAQILIASALALACCTKESARDDRIRRQLHQVARLVRRRRGLARRPLRAHALRC